MPGTGGATVKHNFADAIWEDGGSNAARPLDGDTTADDAGHGAVLPDSQPGSVRTCLRCQHFRVCYRRRAFQSAAIETREAVSDNHELATYVLLTDVYHAIAANCQHYKEKEDE